MTAAGARITPNGLIRPPIVHGRRFIPPVVDWQRVSWGRKELSVGDASNDDYFPSGLGTGDSTAERAVAFYEMLAKEREMLARAPHLALDVAIPGLVPGRYLRITSLTVIEAYDVVRLEYEVVLLDELPTRENAEESRALGPHWWLLSGRDDRGAAYEDLGGTYGLPEDGVVADGERDLRPAPPPDATWLEIAFHAAGEPETVEHARYILKVSLPLGVAFS